MELEEETIFTVMDFCKFGVKQEIQAQYGYGERVRKERSQISFHCKYPKCLAHFNVAILDQNKYKLIKIVEEHDHSAPNDKSQYSSVFYRKYLEHYFQTDDNQRAIAQLNAFKDLEIPLTGPSIPEMYAQKPRAIKRFAERIHAFQTRYSPDDVVSLQIFVQTVQEESPDDLIAFEVSDNNMCFYYASFEGKAYAHSIKTFHIDSTYKLLRSNIPLYAFTGKIKDFHIFPFLYFFCQPDTYQNIQVCVCAYLRWVTIEPEYISMDCAPQIAQAIEESIPQAQILWCGVHVLRAILRKSNKFSSQEKFEQFYNLMKDLVFKLDAEHEEEANAAYDQVLELLDTDPTASQYFNRQWRYNISRLIARDRREGDATNNIAEAHFRTLKHDYFPDRKNLRIDDVIIEIYTKVIPSFVIKLKIDQNPADDRVIRIMEKATNAEIDVKRQRKIESISMLNRLLNAVSDDSIDPTKIYPTLKVLLQRTHFI
ncbi:hypothetical protein TVAG_470300 [Trichomonas vaginalis G3]|uniref:MULE transposase domain-containing protein n=1 Tax=Trichomonas vaginalis (strain ATCC PRA-98 / G3) TaxID=412133 RepID=A2G439_TRIV3|nr:hypothetical protein TVAG_470300 [Trichomonas vaginalis G3]|eukprot:XP_001301003.1 hypothetical protein [Trichomonas vaginalis G3]